jgi:hypothetical protein
MTKTIVSSRQGIIENTNDNCNAHPSSEEIAGMAAIGGMRPPIGSWKGFVPPASPSAYGVRLLAE